MRERDKEIVKAVNSGISVKEVADKYDISVGNVLRICRENNTRPLRIGGGFDRMMNILKQLKMGYNMSDIARNHQVTRQYVHQIKDAAVKAGVIDYTAR